MSRCGHQAGLGAPGWGRLPKGAGGCAALTARAACRPTACSGLKPNATSVGHIFKAFMDKVATPRWGVGACTLRGI